MTLVTLVTKSNTLMELSAEDRSTLHGNSGDRAALALTTINVAMEQFPTLKKGGKSKALKSFSSPAGGLVSPGSSTAGRKKERTDRYLRHAKKHMRRVAPGSGPRSG
ncbi:hypothetical protein [Streptomyces sp. NBC_00233]|uniref:hypothetical protein n=1 Tax=Streptomyces sp. NBC_00233 TaxID=2975686 RepID=UPI0022582A5D|nr:hypothetical protein [Streptomyces sp. NBC_00233]MCX5233209.1 hypothetical protein [Streptomyces sp. NBC_00233]